MPTRKVKRSSSKSTLAPVGPCFKALSDSWQKGKLAEKYPESGSSWEPSMPSLYVAGYLTGIPVKTLRAAVEEVFNELFESDVVVPEGAPDGWLWEQAKFLVLDPLLNGKQFSVYFDFFQ